MSSGEFHENTGALSRRGCGCGKGRRGVGEHELIENVNQVTVAGVFEACLPRSVYPRTNPQFYT